MTYRYVFEMAKGVFTKEECDAMVPEGGDHRLFEERVKHLIPKTINGCPFVGICGEEMRVYQYHTGPEPMVKYALPTPTYTVGQKILIKIVVYISDPAEFEQEGSDVFLSPGHYEKVEPARGTVIVCLNDTMRVYAPLKKGYKSLMEVGACYAVGHTEPAHSFPTHAARAFV